MTSAAQFRALPEREVGLAHLSLLQLEPAELVRVAAAAGFDFVGVRVRAATPGERIADLAPGSAASRATLAALEETGIRIRDIEFLVLDGATGREDWLPMLEAGAALGATTLSLAGNDTDEARMTAALAELAADAADHGIVPTLEPISYNEVSTVAQAVRMARAAGAAILLDPLHLHRSGGTPADVRAALADGAAEETARVVPVLQLCDALLAAPGAELADASMPRGMTADGDPRKLESRALRLAPGEGELPLAELLAGLDPALPLSVEAPYAARVARLGPVGYAEHLLDRTLAVVELARTSEPSAAHVPAASPVAALPEEAR